MLAKPEEVQPVEMYLKRCWKLNMWLAYVTRHAKSEKDSQGFSQPY